MKTKEEILALYEKLCDFSEDIHKDAETYSTCDRIDYLMEEAYAADKEAFMTVFSLENCLALPDWVLSAVITTYKYHGLLENMMRDFRKYACCRHVDGAGERNIRFRKIMLVNLYSENCSVEQGLALNAADRDEGYHYETPDEARYYYETGILRDLFFEDPEAFMKKLAEEGGEFLYDDFRRRCERREIECSCQKDDFKVIPMTVDNKEIVRIVMPLPKKEGDCFEVYLVISRVKRERSEDEGEDDVSDDCIIPHYFKVEKGTTLKDRYLCEWDFLSRYHNYGACKKSADKTLKEILPLVD